MRTSRRVVIPLRGLRAHLGVVGAMLLTTVLLTAAPARAQMSEQWPTPDPAINGRLLRDAIALGTSALERLQGPRAVEDLPSAHKSMDLMYRTVRTALFGMREQKRRTKYDDPLLDYQLGRTGKAWDTIRGPVDRYFNSLPPEVYIEGAIRDLQAAIAILRPVVAVMP